MPESPEILIQSLVDSGILSAEDVTRSSEAGETLPPAGQAGAGSDSGQALLDKLESRGRLSSFQVEVLKREGAEGLILGDYVLLDRLGSGGMGDVFRAQHRVMQREVAIKRLHAKALALPGLVDRFMREVRTAARLTHPNIVTAYDAGEHETGCYLVMEYVPGKDLNQVIRERGPLPIAQAADYLLQAAKALDFAHQAGIVHRDIKPANFLIDDSGTLKLLDLGLARIEQTIAEHEHSADLTLTHAGQIMGTLAYMAPEQAEDPHSASAAADLYALGCTFCAMVTGKPPFPAQSAARALLAHREQPPPDLTDALPAPLNDLYHDLLAKDPADRPASANEVVRALEQMAADGVLSLGPQGSTTATPAAGRIQKTRPRSKTKRKTAAPLHPVLVFSSLGGLVLIAIIAVGYYFLGTAKPAASTEPDKAAPVNDHAQPDEEPAINLPNATILNTTAAAAALQESRATQAGLDLEMTNSLGMTFRYIPAATYRRGSTNEQIEWALQQVTAEGLLDRYGQYIRSESPQTVVKIDQPFYFGQTEVTVGQFRQFVEATGYQTTAETDPDGGVNFTTGQGGQEFHWDNPGMAQDDSHPVINLTQADAIAFCNWLSEKEGVTYSLPTDSEWEFACRAGSLGRWCFGDDPSAFYDYGWCYYNSPNSTQPVAKLKPNAFGLYDMHGNAREWVLLDDGSPNNEAGTGIVRGGSFTKPQVLLRSASRVGFRTTSPYPYHSFRVKRAIQEPTQ